MSEALVTGCADCPLVSLEHDSEGWISRADCTHPDAPDKAQLPVKHANDALPAVAPDWCPLRTGPITLRMK